MIVGLIIELVMSGNRRHKRLETIVKDRSRATSPKTTISVRRSSRYGKISVADPEIVAQWTSLGVTRGLFSDDDIAGFLLRLYSDSRSAYTLSETRCVSCNASLVLYCLSCQLPSSQAPHVTPLQSSENPLSTTRINSELSTSTPSLPLESSRPHSSVGTVNTITVCTSDPSVHLEEDNDMVTQQPHSVDVTKKCEQNILICEGFVSRFHSNERQISSCVNDRDGKETGKHPQKPEPEISLIQRVETHERKGDDESSAFDAEMEESGELQELSAHEDLQSSKADTEPYVCPHCNLILPIAQHRDHVRTHYNCPGEQKVFSCGVCARTFPHFHTLYNHIRLCVSDQRCWQCGETFVSGCQVKMHRKRHEREKARFCEQCQQSFLAMSKKDFDRHLKKHEKKGKPTEAVLCPQCGKVFKKKEDLNHHMTYHNKDSPFPCSLCHKAFKNKVCLRQHELVHGEKTQQCEVCGAKFHRKVGLTRHMQKHTGKQYACGECARRFFSTSELQVHIEAVHKGIRHFPCSLCPLKFHKAASLKIHMRTHTGEKPFSCDQCLARFAVGEALRKHMRRHTGEKPYCCEDCGQTYSCQYSYKMHRKKHHTHSHYACQVCQQVFVVRSSLTFHQKMCHYSKYDMSKTSSQPSDQALDPQSLNLLLS